MDPLKIAITHPYCWPEVRRGAERIIVDMAISLTRLGHDVTVLTAGSIPTDETVDGYRLRRFKQRFGNRERHEHHFGLRIVPALLAGRFDVVHSMMPIDGAAAVATRVAGHRAVYDEMGNPSTELIEGRYDAWARRLVIKRADVYACMSPFSQTFLRDGWGREGILIPGGVRLENARRMERTPEPTILFSGALHRPEKNVGLLLAAAAIVAETRPDVQVWLSGPGDPTAFIEAAPLAAQRLTTVLPVGDPDGQGERYGRAWVTCLPTQWDSFGLVVIESLASATPVVVGPIGGPTDTIGRHPGVGVAAEELTPESLAVALEAGLALAEREDTADRCEAAGREYDWDTALAPLLVDTYRAAIVRAPEVTG